MKSLKIGAYIRVSTEDQAAVYEGSLESQKHRIKEFVDYKNRQTPGWGEIIEVYVEEGVSAGTVNRPMYQKIMSDVRKGKVNLILVSDLTRLSRNLLDFCNLIHELEKYHASYLSMKEQFDTSTPIGRMMVYIIIALGQFEREQTSERVSINVHSRALRGLVNGGPAPLGFDKVTEKPGLLNINESEAAIVRQIFNIFLEEGTRAKTLKRLHSERIFPKRTSKKQKQKDRHDWTVQSLGTLLQNVAYIGYREVNKVYQHKDPSHLKPWQKYQIVKAMWSSIVSENIFYDAQKLLDESALQERTRLSKSVQRVFLLTGLLTCAETGLRLVGQAGHSRSGTVYRYYHYVNKPKGLQVVRPRLSADELENKVFTELKKALKNERYFSNLEGILKRQAEENGRNEISETNRIQSELKTIGERINSLWINQAKMQLNDQALKLVSDELNRLAEEKQSLELRLSQLDPKSSDPQIYKDQALFIENQVRWCLQGWPKASAQVRKRLLRRTIKEILVTKTEIHITFWTTFDDHKNRICEVASGENGPQDKVLAFCRRSRGVQDRNFEFGGSGNMKFGSEGRT